MALARSGQSATVAGSVAGPQPGHTAGPKQVGRGRSRNRRPQISAHGLGGCFGSQADNADCTWLIRWGSRRAADCTPRLVVVAPLIEATDAEPAGGP
jgi:hypothetical protein